MTEAEFQKSCDDFQRDLLDTEPDEFSKDSGTALTIGNANWHVHIFCHEDMEDPRYPLIQLFQSRRDLLRPIIMSSGLRSYISGAYKLGVWMDERGYTVALDARTFWARVKLNLFHAYVWFRHMLSPHG